MSTRSLRISATFTAEPIEQPLEYLLRRVGLAYEIGFAPYNQVMQTLLDPTSAFAGVDGVNVLLLRWEDLGVTDSLARVAADLGRAIRESRAWHAQDLVVLTCPASPTVLASPTSCDDIRVANGVLDSEIGDTPGVHVVSSEIVERYYPVTRYDDAEAERVGHVPYTREWFAAAAMMLVRRIEAMHRHVRKVIVLDCDNTLWRGIVGEDGIDGIALDAGYEYLQQFAKTQRDSGMLLCLSSKNNEQDVWDAFSARPDFPLRPEHIVDWRINWQPKADNIREIARDLDLGLDSFIFIDDNSKECAEMRARCPEVLTLQLPEDPGDIPAYLENVWVFDHWRVTADDLSRSAVYTQKRERERLAQTTSSFEEFIAGLKLVIDIAPLTAEHLPRVSQLTLRTNQFNTTTIRRGEADIESLLRRGYECLTVNVSDRFGSYGLVGVVLHTISGDALTVDSFILSCRALGRGVEHRILAYLGDLAIRAGTASVQVRFVQTAKNDPARSFLESVGADTRKEDGANVLFCFSAAQAAAVVYQPSGGPVVSATDRPSPAVPGTAAQEPMQFDYDHVARELRRPEDVVGALVADGRIGVARPSSAEFVGPRSPIEERLAAIWADTLGLPAVDIRDSFFDLGGTSLLAVQLVSRVIREFGRENLTLSMVLRAPSVEQFRRYVEFEHLPAYECLVPMRPHGPRPPLYFVHGAGGNVLSLQSVMHSLPDDQPFYGLQARGLDGSAPHESVRETAEAYVSEIRRFQPEGPYYIGGACYGGLVAFEMAHVFREQGQEVAFLAMIDTYNYAYSAMISKPKMFYCNARYVARRARHHIAYASALDADARRTYIAEKIQVLRRYHRQIGKVLSGRSRNHVIYELAEVDSAGDQQPNYLVQILNRVIQANLRAQREYVPRRYDGDAVLFRASVPFIEPYEAPSLGWNLIFEPSRIDDIIVPGDHNGIISEPNVQILGRQLDARLKKAQMRDYAATPEE